MSFLTGVAGGFSSGFAGARNRREDDAKPAPFDKAVGAIREKLGIPAPDNGGAEANARGAMRDAPQQGGQVVSGTPGLRDLVDRTEGGGDYRALFNGAHREGGQFGGVDVTNMTLNDLSEFSSPSGQYGQWVKDRLADSGSEPRVATPMGRYQIVGSTLRDAAGQLGLDGQTKFTPEVQDRLFDHLARRRLSGAQSMDEKVASLRQEWRGFNNVPDDELRQAVLLYEGRGVGRPGQEVR